MAAGAESSVCDSHIAATRFGMAHHGAHAWRYQLRNRRGTRVAITNIGATIVSALVPDRLGVLADVVLGYADAGSYLRGRQYLGAVVGRYANRIANARFSLDGVEYRPIANDGPHCMHGGAQAFHQALWQVTMAEVMNGLPTVQLQLHSPDGEGGFPGALQVQASYTLDDDNLLRLDLIAVTDRATVISLTSHPYFNLTGNPLEFDIGRHLLQIAASSYLPVDDALIPTGDQCLVDSTPFDFRTPRPIGDRIDDGSPQLVRAGGYDHTFVTDAPSGELALRASVLEPVSGRTLRVFATDTALQFYSGNQLDGTDIDKHGVALRARSGFCLEPQGFPDAPNQPGFPSARLDPGAVYRSSIAFQFGTLGE